MDERLAMWWKQNRDAVLDRESAAWQAAFERSCDCFNKLYLLLETDEQRELLGELEERMGETARLDEQCAFACGVQMASDYFRSK